MSSASPTRSTVPGRAIGAREGSLARRWLIRYQLVVPVAFAGLWWGSVALLALSMHAAVRGDAVGVGWLAAGGVGVGVARVSAAARGATKGGAMTDVKLH